MPDANPLQLGNALIVLAALAVLAHAVLGTAVHWRSLRRGGSGKIGASMASIDKRCALIEAALGNGIKERLTRQESKMEEVLQLLTRLQALHEAGHAAAHGKKT